MAWRRAFLLSALSGISWRGADAWGWRDSEPESTAAPRRTPTPAASRPVDMPAECEMPGVQYKVSEVCSEATKREWRRLSTFPSQQDACHFEERSGKIVCDAKYACQGEPLKLFSNNTHSKSTMHFDCSKCHDMLKTSCCNECQKLKSMSQRDQLRVSGSKVHEVKCRDCDHQAAAEHRMSCSHGMDGAFKCAREEHCDLGEMTINTTDLSYACVVTQCDKCSETFTKAECCLACLEHFCSSDLTFTDRRVCKGCDLTAARWHVASYEETDRLRDASECGAREASCPPRVQEPPAAKEEWLYDGAPKKAEEEGQWHYGFDR